MTAPVCPVDATSRRQAGIDRLRAGVTLLVVFHHTAITCGGSGGGVYRQKRPDPSARCPAWRA
jgi:hypothetical protein